MFSILQRFQNISNYALTLITSMCIFVAFTSYVQLNIDEYQNLPATITNIKG